MADAPSFQEIVEEVVASEDVGESIMPRRKLEDTEMDITPMIDITFLLLIFFLVASKMDEGANIALPPAKYGVPVPSRNAVVLTVDVADPESPPKVYKGNATNAGEMIDASDLKVMEDEIEAYIEEEMAMDSQKQFVLIKAAEETKHRDVARVAHRRSRGRGPAIARCRAGGELSVVSVTFQCPHCRTNHTAAQSVVGRRVRCPECEMPLDVNESVLVETDEQAEDEDLTLEDDVKSPEDPQGTVNLLPGEDSTSADTVLLEAVEVTEAIERAEPMDVSEAIEDEPQAQPPVQHKPAEPKVIDEGAESGSNPFKKREREETEMDMTPMVDVTFLLLIFFMVTAAFALQKSIEVPKPNAEEASTNAIPVDPEDSPDFVTVRVDEFNTYSVTTVDWEEEAPSVQDLHIQLRRARDGDSTGTVPTKLLVEAHGEATHGRVVAALDAGTATGFEEVQLTTVEEEG